MTAYVPQPYSANLDRLDGTVEQQRAALEIDSAVSIRAFGAVGDGVANDTEAIANAIAYAKSSGIREVFVPAGTYLTDTITTLESGMTFRGSGEQSVLKSRTGTTVIHLTGPTWTAYMKLEDFTIQGAGQFGNSGHGILIQGAGDYPRHCELSKIKIMHCGGSGVRGLQPNLFSSVLRDVHVEDCGGDLIFFDYLGPASTFLNCYGERPLVDKWCYRVDAGYITMLACNGQDNIWIGTQVLPESRGGYAKLGGSNALVVCVVDSCNIEGWSNVGIEIGNNSIATIRNCAWGTSLGQDGAPNYNPPDTSVAIKLNIHSCSVLIENCQAVSGNGWKWGHPIHGSAASKVMIVGDHGRMGTHMAIDANTAIPLNYIDSEYLGGTYGHTPRIRKAKIDLLVDSKLAQGFVSRDGQISGGTWNNTHLVLAGDSDANKKLTAGYDTTDNIGVLQAGFEGVAFSTIALSPFGGNVVVGKKTDDGVNKLQVNGSIQSTSITVDSLVSNVSIVCAGSITTPSGFQTGNATSVGAVGLKSGTATNTGFVEFLTAAGVRRGYLGFDTGASVTLTLEGGSKFVVSGGSVQLNLPTSNPGAGLLWNDGGTVKVGT